MPEQKIQLIEKLTGVYTSKRSYYVELKEKVKELSKRNAQLEILNELAQEFNITLPRDYLDKTVKKIYDSVRQILYLSRIAILTPYGENLLVDYCYISDDNCSKGIEITPDDGESLWKAINSNNQIVWQRSADTKDGFLHNQGLEVAVINPLVTHNKVYGLFVVGSDRYITYDPLDLAFFQQLANQIAIYLQDGALFSEVNRAKLEWEATFKAVRDIIIMVDPDLKILRLNQAALDFRGIPEQEIYGKKYCDVFCTADGPCSECSFYEALRTGEMINFQRQLSDGRVMEVYGYPASQGQKNLGLVIYIRDITEQLKMQVQLLQTARLAALGEMAAGVAHELNTPLAVIIGDAQLLLRTTPQNDQKYKILEDIETCGQRCKRIVRGLLTFSRQEQYVFQPLNVNDVVKDALSLVSYHIEKNKIRIYLSLDEQLPNVEGNSQQLEQVIVNLLLNAKQAFDEDEEELEQRITVKTGLDKERNQVFIKVADNGPGIPQEIVTKIFDPFFTSKGDSKGTGLGLSVSLGIVQKHGGTIAVESEPGKGAEFTVYLPPSQRTADCTDSDQEG